MAIDSNNCIWDKNGSCLNCGFIPFNLTEQCYVCNLCINISNCMKNTYDKGNNIDIYEYAEEEPLLWEINREKSIIIDEDNSSSHEISKSSSHETGDIENVDNIEDNIYTRIIKNKDIVVKKNTNINSIFLGQDSVEGLDSRSLRCLPETIGEIVRVFTETVNQEVDEHSNEIQLLSFTSQDDYLIDALSSEHGIDWESVPDFEPEPEHERVAGTQARKLQRIHWGFEGTAGLCHLKHLDDMF